MFGPVLFGYLRIDVVETIHIIALSQFPHLWWIPDFKSQLTLFLWSQKSFFNAITIKSEIFTILHSLRLIHEMICFTRFFFQIYKQPQMHKQTHAHAQMYKCIQSDEIV